MGLFFDWSRKSGRNQGQGNVPVFQYRQNAIGDISRTIQQFVILPSDIDFLYYYYDGASFNLDTRQMREILEYVLSPNRKLRNISFHIWSRISRKPIMEQLNRKCTLLERKIIMKSLEELKAIREKNAGTAWSS